MADHHAPVLVIGGSLVGLSASLLLASSGVPHRSSPVCDEAPADGPSPLHGHG